MLIGVAKACGERKLTEFLKNGVINSDQCLMLLHFHRIEIVSLHFAALKCVFSSPTTLSVSVSHTNAHCW